ncbi:MAG: protein O-mannosyl-transferase family [Candidatus Limnocylindrales bacterium]
MTDRIGRWFPPLAVGLVAFAAARVAMLPGLGFWDTAELQTVAPVLGTAHPTGFPTYVLLGWLANLILAPFGEPALRMNLFAGLCVAVAAAVTVDLVRALTRSVALGVLAGVGLALTEIAWSIGTQAEAHALHLAFVAILLRTLVAWEDRAERGDRHRDRWLIMAAAVFGLAMGNHSLTLLLAPAVGLFVFAVEPGIVRRPRLVVACAIALIVTVVAVYLELPLRAGPFRAPLVYGRPETWDGFWYVALAEQFRGSVNGPFSELGPKVAELVARTARAFGPLAIVIPLAFVATALSRPRYAVLSGSALAITCFFAASYINADIERYYLGPALIVWTWLAILAGGAASFVSAKLDGRAGAGADPGSGMGRAVRVDHGIAVALAVALLVPTIAALPERLRRVDRSRDTLAREWVDRALARLAPDAIVVSWWSYSTPLWYAQHVEGRRPDIAIIDDRTRLDEHLGELTDVIDANLSSRPVYVIRNDPSEISALERRYVLEPLDGVTGASLSRVVARREAGS